MQLHFSAEELTMLANVLLEETKAARALSRDEAQRRKAQLYAELTDKVLACHLQFAFDELQELADALCRRRDRLAAEIGQARDARAENELQRKHILLERVLERVNEACVVL